MTNPKPEDCAVHIRRIDEVERHVEKLDAKAHKLTSVVTGLQMQGDLLEVEHQHSRAEAGKIADGAADMLLAQGKQLLALEKLSSKSESTERVLKWVLAVVTSVGVGTAIIVLSQVLKADPQ